ncbi:poly-gamma-glutamate synthesis protein (capsule biosynthesis protein) [Lipingzhangella halophila]|uniref:Poly-gamma-glutamate synthesis protein (Capsule biosynthesis protein) n=1 Tax=Lipingzhangella halophila TaxID=1783352 RepID=A0A7W7RMR9_9ACTN|nr:CapA family protein [Lipingzhangella halophila]MBB4934448.1 poly-gamma-glutamate synthesis protein (capsule biosynthesis protein) [Lipingzhangella halophila]
MAARTHPPHPFLLRRCALLAVAVLVLALSGEPDAPGPAEDQGATAEEADAPESPAGPQPFTVAFGGDVMFDGILADRLDSDPGTAMGPVSEVFARSDLSIVNLETAVTEGGTSAPAKEFVFRAPPSAYEALHSAEVDVATVANNHGMDYGVDGLEDTLDHAEDAGFPIVGAGRNADEAYSPHRVEVNGNTVAILGATDVIDGHLIPDWVAGDGRPGLASVKGEALERMLEAVGEAEAEADTVLTYLHAGLEGEHCPLPHAPDLARQLIDAGADVVVNSHAHVLGPGGYLDGAYVHYGLGNFAFYNFSGPTAETGVLRLTMREGEVLEDEWLPGRIRGGVPTLYEGEQATSALGTWEGYRDTCGLELGDEP